MGARADLRSEYVAAHAVTVMEPDHQKVQERRRAIVHAIIHTWPHHRTNAVACVVSALQKRTDWPVATWQGARQGPPDYQQVLNYMNTLLKEGKLDKATGWWVSVVAPDTQERFMRKRASEALRLQSEGKNGTQIAEELGISRSLAYGLINDPYGERERERKRDYCPVCGAKKDGSVTWCRACKTGKIEDLLPPKDFMRFVHRAWREQKLEVLFGVTPDCVRVIRIGTGRGVIEHALPSHQSWDDAVEELGLS